MYKVPECVLDRRSIRHYTGEVVSDGQIRALLEAAMLAPSANNRQPWHFVVVRDKGMLSELPKYHPYAAFASQAGCVIAVCGDAGNEYVHQDCAAAIENLMIAAKAIGLGTCWCGVMDRRRVEGIRGWIGLDDKGVIPIALVVLGYPAREPARPNRYDERKVHYDKW
jgi:nitroreductase